MAHTNWHAVALKALEVTSPDGNPSNSDVLNPVSSFLNKAADVVIGGYIDLACAVDIPKHTRAIFGESIEDKKSRERVEAILRGPNS